MRHHTTHVRSICNIVVMIVAATCTLAAPVGAQPDSYQYLTRDASALADRYLTNNGLRQGALGYNELSVSQRSTFEAIVYALYALGILAIVDEVTEIWGSDPLSNAGTDQFRLSVKLTEGAVDFLVAHDDYNHSMFGHVKLPGGVVGFFGADSVRRRGSLPRIQISWLEQNPTIGEIDIDYRGYFEHGHNRADNSDIRATALPGADGSAGESHFSRFTGRFGVPPEINEWWRSQ